LTLKFDDPLLDVAFNCNLRRYRKGVTHATAKKVHAALHGGTTLLLILGGAEQVDLRLTPD